MKATKARRKRSSIGALLQLFVRSVSFKNATSSSGEGLHGAVSGNNYIIHPKRMKAIYLEVERRKAEAFEFSRRHIVY